MLVILNKCLICNKIIDKRYKYCKNCSMKKRFKNMQHPRYIDGRCLKQYFCIDCNKKISISSGIYGTKRCNHCSMIYKIKKGIINNKGKNHSQYIDGRTLKDYYCINCKKLISWQNYLFGNRRCQSCAKKGKKSHFYINGLSRKPYSSEFSDELKEYIRKRDNYKCQLCNKRQKNYYRKLEIHHIDYNKKNCNESNLITLCQQCNVKANANKDYWFAYFTYIMENK